MAPKYFWFVARHRKNTGSLAVMLSRMKPFRLPLPVNSKKKQDSQSKTHGWSILKKSFFYHDVWQKSFHSLRFYYLCDVESTDLIDDADVIGGESEKPRWIAISSLAPSDFDQEYGFELLEKQRDPHSN